MKVKNLKIASYLIEKGLLTVKQAKIVMEIQNNMHNVSKQRFGRIAVNQGFIKENVLNKVMLEKEKKEFGIK
ncbi:MAG: hypothetical protein JW881_17010 [Spirochaetales bacterium]|nr:hypothetical protein [Spirochaetales bacterium]